MENEMFTVAWQWANRYVRNIGVPLSCVVFMCFFSKCSSRHESVTSESSVKFEQYYLQGEQLYESHCSNCHQKNGKGLGLVYPPLDTSDFMDTHFDEVICLMDNGRTGELIVNGKNFNKTMPGIPSLTDLEIAEIGTYIYNTWTHKRGLADVKEVTSILSRCTNEEKK